MYKLSNCGAILFDNLIVPRLDKKFPTIYFTQQLITVFTGACTSPYFEPHPSIPWSLYPVSLRSLVRYSETAIHHFCVRRFPAVIFQFACSWNITHMNNIWLCWMHHSLKYCAPLAVVLDSVAWPTIFPERSFLKKKNVVKVILCFRTCSSVNVSILVITVGLQNVAMCLPSVGDVEGGRPVNCVLCC
jgi:hypothetical protein